MVKLKKNKSKLCSFEGQFDLEGQGQGHQFEGKIQNA